MAQLRSLALIAALGLAGVAYGAQTPAPPDPTDAQTAPPTTTTPDEQKQQDSDPAAASSPHQKGTIAKAPAASAAADAPKLVGLQVQSPGGEALGSVIDVTMDASKQPEYAVLSTGNDTMTAVPYAAVASMVKGDKVVMDRSKLQNSPQVAQSELKDKKNSKWRADADRYW